MTATVTVNFSVTILQVTVFVKLLVTVTVIEKLFVILKISVMVTVTLKISVAVTVTVVTVVSRLCHGSVTALSQKKLILSR